MLSGAQLNVLLELNKHDALFDPNAIELSCNGQIERLDLMARCWTSFEACQVRLMSLAYQVFDKLFQQGK